MSDMGISQQLTREENHLRVFCNFFIVCTHANINRTFITMPAARGEQGRFVPCLCRTRDTQQAAQPSPDKSELHAVFPCQCCHQEWVTDSGRPQLLPSFAILDQTTERTATLRTHRTASAMPNVRGDIKPLMSVQVPANRIPTKQAENSRVTFTIEAGFTRHLRFTVVNRPLHSSSWPVPVTCAMAMSRQLGIGEPGFRIHRLTRIPRI